MTSQYRHRRTSNPATAMPNLEPGEIGVNTANRQIAVGDAASATLGVPKPLLAIRFFDIAAIYAIGDIVTNADKIWRAIAANGPGSFNAANWELAASQVTIAADPPSNAVAGSMWWDSDNGMLYVRYNDGDSSQWVQATAMPVVDTSSFVLKAGDTMTGDLTVAKATPAFSLDKTASGLESQIWGKTAGVNRWKMALGDASPETGSHLGSAFTLHSRSDDGTLRQLVLTAPRDTGLLSVAGDPTAALGVATKQYVDARAGDAMAYSGMQINGSMEVSQEFGGSGTAVVNTNKEVLDRWRVWSYGAQVMGGSQDVASPCPGYTNNLIAFVNGTANAAPAAADAIFISQNIEGYRVSRLAWGTAGARSITIGFWVFTTRTGTASIGVRNSAVNRSYVTTFTVSAASTWEYKTVTIPGDTTGTWLKDNGIGISLFFTFMSGSSGLTAPNVWAATGNISATGVSNFISTVGDLIRLTGVVILPGTQAPTAAQSPLLMRPYDQELVTCQRYYRQKTPEGGGICSNATSCYFVVEHRLMRAAPTALVTSPLVVTDIFTNYTQTSPNVANVGPQPHASFLTFGNFFSMTGGKTVIFHPGQAPNIIALDARL